MKQSYGMFSMRGNQLVYSLVKRVVKKPMSTTNDELLEMVREGMNKIAVKHGEVWDTDVREQMIGSIEKITGRELTIWL